MYLDNKVKPYVDTNDEENRAWAKNAEKVSVKFAEFCGVITPCLGIRV